MDLRLHSKLYQLLFLPFLGILCIAAIFVLQKPQLSALKKDTNLATLETSQKELKAEELNIQLLKIVPAFGYNNLLGNWTFLKFIQYFGDDEARKLTDYRLSPEYFEVILDRDPKFLMSYLFLSTSSTLYAGMPERSVTLMEKGLKSLSPTVPLNSYYIWRYKATDELLFLSNAQAAKQSFEKAAEWASNYSDTQSQFVAAMSRRTAGFLEKNPNSKTAQINAWFMVLSNAFDKRTRQEAITRIEALGGKVDMTPEGRLRIQFPEEK